MSNFTLVFTKIIGIGNTDRHIYTAHIYIYHLFFCKTLECVNHETRPSTYSTNWATPSPSHSPITPPNVVMKSNGGKGGYDDSVTVTSWSRVKSNVV